MQTVTVMLRTMTTQQLQCMIHDEAQQSNIDSCQRERERARMQTMTMTQQSKN